MKRLSLLACAFAFYSCNSNLTECRELYSIEIPPYKLVKKKCPAPGGTDWYPVTLYKGSENIDEQVWNDKDTCHLIYRSANDLYLQMNICEKTVIELRPDRTTLDIQNVDSIRMYAVLQKQTKTLSQSQVEKFVEDWNNSVAEGYRQDSVDLVFFPTSEYELTTFTKSGTKKFLASNYLITERTHWVYLITGKKSAHYFKNLWEK